MMNAEQQIIFSHRKCCYNCSNYLADKELCVEHDKLEKALTLTPKEILNLLTVRIQHMIQVNDCNKFNNRYGR